MAVDGVDEEGRREKRVEFTYYITLYVVFMLMHGGRVEHSILGDFHVGW